MRREDRPRAPRDGAPHRGDGNKQETETSDGAQSLHERHPSPKGTCQKILATSVVQTYPKGEESVLSAVWSHEGEIMNEESIAPPQETIQEAPVVPVGIAAGSTPAGPPPGVSPTIGGAQFAPQKAPAIAWVALGIAIFAMVIALIPFATFGSGLFILVGLILSIVALAKTRAKKGASITALILSLAAVPATIAMSILSFGLIAAVGTTLNSTIIEEQITSGISEQLGIDAVVTCPDVMTGSIGTVFQCQAVDPNGDYVTVDVTVTDSAGGMTWEIRS